MYSEQIYIYIYIYIYICVCVCVCVYFVYTTDIYSIGSHMSTFGTVIHCIGLGCQSLQPQEIHVCNRNLVFDLHSVFHKCNPGIRCDLPV
jgi:hypothetical protein